MLTSYQAPLQVRIWREPTSAALVVAAALVAAFALVGVGVASATKAVFRPVR